MNWIRYATNDDTTMVAIAAGGYGGEPSPYVVNIHYLIGYLLKTLYVRIPDVNWFTVWYLSMYLLAFTFITYIIVKSCRLKRSVLFVCLMTAAMSFYLFMSFFSFTVVAYALLTAGMAGVSYAEGQNSHGTSGHHTIFAISIIYIILAAMMRSDVINTAIVMIMAYGITTSLVFRDKRYLKSIVAMLLILAIIELLAASSNTWLLKREATEAAFFEWGEIRSKALDCTQVPYDEGLFAKHDFSEASYDACYGAFYYIRDAVSINHLQHLIDWNTNRYHPHIIGYVTAHFRAYAVPGYGRIWQGLFAFVVLAGIVTGCKKSRIKMLGLYASVIAADYAYYFIGRPMLHVMMPTYVMGSLLGATIIAYTIGGEGDGTKTKPNMSYRVCVGSAILFFVIAAGSIYKDPAIYSMTLTTEEADALHEGREYMRDHPDKLFVAMDPAVFAISTDEDMWHNRYASEPYNLAGNWEIYSLPSNAMMESYGIDPTDPGKDFVDNDKVVFLSSRADGVDTQTNYITELYREYYGIGDVEFKLIENLENWTAWKLEKAKGEENKRKRTRLIN